MKALAEATMATETLTGRQSTFQWWTSALFGLEEFKEADVIHLQIVHDHLITIDNLVRVFEEKPTVWTWHDLWPLTGHCTQPLDCQRWDQGCGNCPALNLSLPVYWDRTNQERLRKSQNLLTCCLSCNSFCFSSNFF
jgi:hypothetical protein